MGLRDKFESWRDKRAEKKYKKEQSKYVRFAAGRKRVVEREKKYASISKMKKERLAHNPVVKTGKVVYKVGVPMAKKAAIAFRDVAKSASQVSKSHYRGSRKRRKKRRKSMDLMGAFDVLDF